MAKCVAGISILSAVVTGCTTLPESSPVKTAQRNPVKVAPDGKVTYNYTAQDRECLKRAMYAESRHSDHDGYMAVGTVVTNRLTSPAYPKTICGVVTQERQFAPGVMTGLISPTAEPELDAAADAILHGQRHPGVQDAMFFHTQGLKYNYPNMHYVVAAGGNIFYEKRARDGSLETPAPLPAYEVSMNFVPGQGSEAYVPGQTLAAYAPSQPAAAQQQFNFMLPETGPVPTLVPTSYEAAVPAVAAPIAIPTLRPDFNKSSASLY